jgi:hypothetical protein
MPNLNEFYVAIEGMPFTQNDKNSIAVNFIFFTGRILRIIYTHKPQEFGMFFTKHYELTENGKPFYNYTANPDSIPSFEEEGPSFRPFCDIYAAWFAKHIAEWTKEWFLNPEPQFELKNIGDMDPNYMRLKDDFAYLRMTNQRPAAVAKAADIYGLTVPEATKILESIP